MNITAIRATPGCPLVGNRWMMNAFRFLKIPSNPSVSPIILYGLPLYYQIEFYPDISGTIWKVERT